jgi:hypothetical protein
MYEFRHPTSHVKFLCLDNYEFTLEFAIDYVSRKLVIFGVLTSEGRSLVHFSPWDILKALTNYPMDKYVSLVSYMEKRYYSLIDNANTRYCNTNSF